MKKRRVLKIGILSIVLIGILSSLYLKFDRDYKKEKRAYYQPKIQAMEELVRQEKDWIKKNQGPLGQIYMNSVGQTEGKNAKDINPYFASLAAQSLLVGQTSREDLEAVGAYINWHGKLFIEEDGQMQHYKELGDGQVIASSPDSLDSYISVFLSLLSQYLEKAEGEEIKNYYEIISLGIENLEELTSQGLTQVSFESPEIYLMDNIEVQAGYRDLLKVAQEDQFKTYLEGAIEDNQEAIVKKLWNKKEERYEIGLSAGGEIIKFQDEKELYPDAISQIYNIAFDIYPSGEKSAEKSYQEFNRNISWEGMEFRDEDVFFWSELAYISARMDDIDRTEVYLASYRQEVDRTREYPFHTASAGWIVKTGVQLGKTYEQRINSSLIEDVLKGRYLVLEQKL